MAGLPQLQAVLAGEHAAVYAYGVIGGRSTGPDRRLAEQAYARHRERRNHLVAVVYRLGAEPVPAEVGYRLPFPIDSGDAVRRLAARVESRCATLYAAAVAATEGATRSFAAQSLAECAESAVAWGDPGEPFPGLESP